MRLGPIVCLIFSAMNDWLLTQWLKHAQHMYRLPAGDTCKRRTETRLRVLFAWRGVVRRTHFTASKMVCSW
jgi:hypothetical protein